MHSFQSLCSLLLCNALVVAAQRKLQKVPEQEENVMRIRMPQTLSRGEMVKSVSKAFLGINISM
ncbi:anterior gradient protein 2 -like protein [Chelydra serpentina]|uniref:Anterior gradient protein 2 -like protein n=1 Tax=Chelydra serpentina TaxID=8475 RepID=A0A8T1S9Y5_CHESE|nr:anterior gradient protein 2 -like protein [Chelydra serpentina]